jgi:ribosome-associated translation inhibitor RaiA
VCVFRNGTNVGRVDVQVSVKSNKTLAITRAIALASQALEECDEHGIAYAAIDLCSAIEKLKSLRPVATND